MLRKNPEGKDEASSELCVLSVTHSWVEEVGLMCDSLHSSLPSPSDRIAGAVNTWGATVCCCCCLVGFSLVCLFSADVLVGVLLSTEILA